MKKVTLLFLFLFFSGVGHAQFFVKAGANFSWMSVDDLQGDLENMKVFPAIGFGYRRELGTRFEHEVGLYYSDIGSINSPNNEPPVKLYIHSLVFDQYLSYRLNERFRISVSPSIYYVLHAGITGKRNNRDAIVEWKALDPLALSLNIRMSYSINQRLSLNLFYREDLTDIGSPGHATLEFINYSIDQKGHGFGFHVHYALGNLSSEEGKRKVKRRRRR